MTALASAGARRAPWAAALALAALHFASFEPLSRPIATDVRFYLYQAWRVAEGDVPHADYFDVKSQLASVAGAALFRLGDAVGVDPLVAIRCGYLALAAVGGLLAFAVHRRLAGGSAVAGLLGLLAHCSFGLLGVLPATGNVPKLWMAVLAPGAALLVHSRRWLAAGVAGGLAILDWQVGALVLAAAAAGALASGTRRLRATGLVLAGGAAAIAPFAAWYAAHGALGDALRQTLLASFAQGASRAGSASRLWRTLALSCPEQEWLLLPAAAGAPVVAVWLWRRRGRDGARLLLSLAVYHFGIAGFSSLDFQAYGDAFALLHSLAFFLGATWVAIHGGLVAGLARVRPGASARRLASAAAALLLIAAAAAGRPGFARPELVLRVPQVRAGATLADQRQVARAVRRAAGGGRLAAFDSAEILFLLRERNPLPAAFFNDAVWRAFRSGPDESMARTATRMLVAVDPDAFVFAPGLEPGGALAGYRSLRLLSNGRRYFVPLRVRPERRTPPAPSAPR